MVQIKELPQVGFKEAAINAFKKMFSSKDASAVRSIGGAIWY